jgi:AcrR family transcriptional regulator
MSPDRPYHHGDLRPALLAAAVDVIAEAGAAGMSLREVARRAGVSHTAATYHFGDKRGLLTTVAEAGYRALASELRAARDEHRSFLEVGVAYVRFAVTHPAHFEVMFQPALHDPDAPGLQEAEREAAAVLYGGGDLTEERTVEGVAAWSLVHGLATLWLNGNLPSRLGTDPAEITRAVAARLRVRKR